MSIILNLRDGKLVIPKDYYSKYLDFDWFFSKMIEFENDSCNNEYTLWEDKNALLSIFDSLKFSKLVIHQDVSLEYLSSLCEMWIVPEWIKQGLEEKRKQQEEERKHNNNHYNKIYMCKNCGVGFKINENKNDSCNFHNLGIRSENSRYYCCGSLHTTENTFCRIGYHIGNAEE